MNLSWDVVGLLSTIVEQRIPSVIPNNRSVIPDDASVIPNDAPVIPNEERDLTGLTADQLPFHGQVFPFRVQFKDKRNFLLASPALDLFFLLIASSMYGQASA